MSTAGFYRAFEEKFYAPRSVIKGLREQYLPFVSPLKVAYAGAPTFDVGCGRGEWLELMLEAGFQPFGIDLDEGMLQACRERGLPAQQGDAIEYLQSLDDSSQVIISAFHVVEHISFEQLQTLVIQSLRVLKPGGLLIMETPNPENIVVATNNFYLDPTHQRPVPSLLLGFLPEFHGFDRVATLRLQESPEMRGKEEVQLVDVLRGVSPDYAIVAQKAADLTITQPLDDAFSKPYGLDLINLASRFDQGHEEVRTTIRQSSLALTGQQKQLDAIEVVVDGFREELDAIRMERDTFRMERDTVEADRNATQVERDVIRTERDALRNSLSWRVTSPLRVVGTCVAAPVSFAMKTILQNPHLTKRINKILVRFPRLHTRLRDAAIARGIVAEQKRSQTILPPVIETDLSPRAREIYSSLRQEIARQEK